MKKLTTILILFFAISCSNVPVTSIPKLQAIDFKTTDLSKLATVAKIPNVIDTSTLEITYTVEIESGENKESFSSILQEWKGDAETQALIAKNAENGYQLLAYKFPSKDIAKAQSMRKLGDKWKEENGNAKGRAGVFFKNICLKAEYKGEKLKGNLWVRTEETGSYILLLKNLDITPDKTDEANFKCK